MAPLTNSQIAAQARETAKKFGAQPQPAQGGPIMLSYQYGSYALVWVANPSVPAEVRDSLGRVIFSGSREDCVSWIGAKGLDAS